MLLYIIKKHNLLISLLSLIIKVGFVEEKTFQGRLLSHAMKDHIVRVANEAEFILNRWQKIILILDCSTFAFQNASGRCSEALRVWVFVHFEPERSSRGRADVRSSHFCRAAERCCPGRWSSFPAIYFFIISLHFTLNFPFRSVGGQAWFNP